MTIFTPCNSTVDEISEAVRQKLLHYINRIRDDINRVEDNLRRNLTSLINEKVTSLRESVSEDLMDYKNQTASDLQSNTQQLCAKMDAIDMKMEAHDNHVTTELMELDQNLQQNFSLQLNNSFGYIYPVYTCGGTGGWRRVVYLNFTDPNTPCPSGWRLTSHSKRTCGRVNTSASCDSVSFPVSGGDYTRVCGRIIAYQDRTTDAFWAHDRVTTIDGPYVDGVSLTHGSPRQHIWTFATGFSEVHERNNNYVCPCDATIDITTPPFVGGDYFCESGHNLGSYHSVLTTFQSDDPLWDGDGCTATSTCCSFNNPPYFTKEFPSPTTDDIEARLCHDESQDNEDTPIEFIELYVQ